MLVGMQMTICMHFYELLRYLATLIIKSKKKKSFNWKWHYRAACTVYSLHYKWMWTETLHSCLHSNIKVHSLPDAVSSFLCIQAMNVMLASWHTGQPTFLSLCLVYMWQGHNRVPDNRPLIEWLAGSGIHPRSSVTLQPRAPYGSWSVSGCTLLWRRGEGAAMLEIWERSQRSGWLKKKKNRRESVYMSTLSVH